MLETFGFNEPSLYRIKSRGPFMIRYNESPLYIFESLATKNEMSR